MGSDRVPEYAPEKTPEHLPERVGDQSQGVLQQAGGSKQADNDLIGADLSDKD